MKKLIRYNNLVAKFKTHQFKDLELVNPHNIDGFNFEVINPWELWHNDLNADIMFIGQDFSDTVSLQSNLSNNWEKEKKTATNKKIIEFFNILGYPFHEIDYTPNSNTHKLFFTNAILGIKQSDVTNMSKPVKEAWCLETIDYLKELIDIVDPKYIIVMGKVAYKALCSIYNIIPKETISQAIGEPIKLPNNKTLFIVQHCSPLGQRTRPLKDQVDDWINIKEIMKN
ncbi:MAG: uracil-DNA glycosylase family protein [Candidatus Chryseobacterium colombiense]|nr:uracil-DNA glycosylase family protein [Chryseobacterium sp.]WEK71015.1 MAG: uracil-DNA glycosylase family protein [Chryseobacterium sp.]